MLFHLGKIFRNENYSTLMPRTRFHHFSTCDLVQIESSITGKFEGHIIQSYTWLLRYVHRNMSSTTYVDEASGKCVNISNEIAQRKEQEQQLTLHAQLSANTRPLAPPNTNSPFSSNAIQLNLPVRLFNSITSIHSY